MTIMFGRNHSRKFEPENKYTHTILIESHPIVGWDRFDLDRLKAGFSALTAACNISIPTQVVWQAKQLEQG